MLSPWKESYDQSRQHIKKQRHYFANKGPPSQGYGFSSSHLWMWELDYKESSAPKNWYFWPVVLEKTLESPLDCKDNQPVHPKDSCPGCSLEGLMLKLKLQYFGHLTWRADSEKSADLSTELKWIKSKQVLTEMLGTRLHSVQFSHSVMSNSLRPHGLQHHQHLVFHWVGQKVHSSFSKKLLCKTLNKIFGQPTDKLNPVPAAWFFSQV